MAYSLVAPTKYKADDLARVIDIPEMFRGETIQLIGPGAHISSSGIVYYPFQSEDEVLGWVEEMNSSWWDDETV
jgi:hypothetical protein